MILRFQKLDPSAVIPERANPGDAGLDLTAISLEVSNDGIYSYGFGLAVEIPEGYVGLIFPRSSIYKNNMALTNSVGVIDSGYRGQLKANFIQVDRTKKDRYVVGERVAQLVIMPFVEVTPAQAIGLTNTQRGKGGFGSSGN
jgi:dUTP pyrophosphatase